MKILLCNEAFYGDLILSSAVLPVLKKALPGCKIGFLVGSWAKEVVRDHIHVDWVHSYDQVTFNRKSISRNAKREIEKKSKKIALQEVRSIGYDIALDLHSYYRENSAHFLYKTEIPKRVAFCGCKKTFFYNEILFWHLHAYHMMENHRKMLLELGINSSYLENFLPHLEYHTPIKPPPSDLPQNYFLIHVGTGEPLREWEIGSWKQLVQKLDSLGHPLVFIGHGKKEQKKIDYLKEGLTHAHDFGNRFSWKELLPVVQKGQFLIGLESMAGHLAAHFGIPALLIYAGGANWRPYHPYCHIVEPALHYQKNHKALLPKQPIHTITPDEVFEKAVKILRAKKLI